MDLDSAVFDGAGAGAVDIFGTDINAFDVDFTSASDYTLGTGTTIPINVLGTLNQSGSGNTQFDTIVNASNTTVSVGKLTIDGDTGSVGTATVSGGELAITADLSGADSDITVQTGGTASLGDATLGEGLLSSGSSVQVDAGGTLNIDNASSTDLVFAMTGAGTINNNGGSNFASDMSGFTGTMELNGGSMNIRAAADDTFDNMTLNINDATMGIFPGSAVRTFGGTINLNDDNALIRIGNNGVAELVLDGDINVNANGELRNDGQARLTVNGNITVASGMTVEHSAGGNIANGDGTVVNGNITGAGGLLKTTNGELQLNGINDYAGPTTVSAGTIVLDAAATLTNTDITIDSGAELDVSAKVGGYSLAGRDLTANGTVTGNVNASAGANVNGEGSFANDLSLTGSTLHLGSGAYTATNALRAYWSFDADGTDAQGNYNASLVGTGSVTIDTVSATAAGAGSLAFSDPTQDDDRAETDVALDNPAGGDARAISFWFNSAVAQEDSTTFLGAGADATGQRFDIKVAGSDALRVEYQGTGVTFADSDTVTGTFGNWLDGNWHHILVQVPENGSIDDVELYLDGVQVNNDGSGNEAVTLNTALTNLYFGDSHNGAADRNFQGNLDDVQVYSQTLDAGQIATIFANPRHRAGPARRVRQRGP